MVGTTVGEWEADDSAREALEAVTAAVLSGELGGERLAELRAKIGPPLAKRMAEVGNPVRAEAVRLAAAWGDPAALEETRRTVRGEGGADDGARVRALEVLVAARDGGLLPVVAAVLEGESSRGLVEGVLDAVGRLDDPRLADVVLGTFDRMAPEVRPRAVELLCGREAWGRALVEAVSAGRVPAAAVGVNQVRRLQRSGGPEVVEAVKRIWGAVREGRNEQREMVVGQMRNFLRKTPGDALAGRKVFDKLCAQCHVMHGQGQEVGPDITRNGRNDFDQLLSNVFDPNLVIGPAYQAVNVATTDGRVLTGLLVEDGPERVVLKLQGGKVEVIGRAEVEELAVTRVSLMPEGMEAQLTPQEIADLFAYLALDRPPEDPEAKRLPGAPAPAGR
jgi:putative heme-binding domain-containing protein